MIESDTYRVLLVEDNELDARAMSRALTAEAECEVERVADLGSGVAAVEAGMFDCVLLDLSLPDSEGLVSVETMVARSPHCPVVVLTGLDDPQIAVEAVSRGAQDYLVKNTITPELVTRAIRYAITRHSSETELREVHSRLADMSSREQIARDLHDTVIQRLFATGMALQAAAKADTRDEVANRTMQAVDQIDDAIRELRQAIFGLHSVDENESLAYELSQLADSYGTTLGFDPVVRLGEIPGVPSEVHQDVVATVREALSNVAKHANATAVTVSVWAEHGMLIARITDNGQGPAVRADETDGLTGHGLKNMKSRAEAHGGTLRVDSGSSGGTELIWSAQLSPL